MFVAQVHPSNGSFVSEIITLWHIYITMCDKYNNYHKHKGLTVMLYDEYYISLI